MLSLIETHQLTRRFGPTLAVDRVDLKVEGPGIIGLLGPNGAGKTTLIRMLTGTLEPSSGGAIVCGHPLDEARREVQARVGYLPERPPLYPELRVGEYLRFVAEIRGVPQPRIPERIADTLERVGLQGAERRLLGALSKGFRQRVGLAQALVHDPPLLLLDEPTAGLDPAQTQRLRGLLVELSARRTVIWCTHQIQEAERVCAQVLLLHRGALVGQGTVAELVERAGAGEPWVELQVKGPPAGWVEGLRRLPLVKRVQLLQPGRVAVVGEGELLPALLEDAARAGYAVQKIRAHPPSLELAFFALTRSEAEPAP